MADVKTRNKLTPPRVALVDTRTGLITREWFRFFSTLFTDFGFSVDDADSQQIAPVTSGGDVAAAVAAILGDQINSQPSTADLASSVAMMLSGQISDQPYGSAIEQLAGIRRAVEDLQLLPVAMPAVAAASSASKRFTRAVRTGAPNAIAADFETEIYWTALQQEAGIAAAPISINANNRLITTSPTLITARTQAYVTTNIGADFIVKWVLSDTAFANSTVPGLPASSRITIPAGGTWMIPSPQILMMQSGTGRAMFRLTLKTPVGAATVTVSSASIDILQDA